MSCSDDPTNYFLLFTSSSDDPTTYFLSSSICSLFRNGKKSLKKKTFCLMPPALLEGSGKRETMTLRRYCLASEMLFYKSKLLIQKWNVVID